ncbi:ABC transporter permease [Bacillus alkalicellulosilyticus]|uniref:ABC transporter permease n=1 Tax=Alkalihalobacterium alkalicellulosilyticum TaxID=1912214 RepID=UPI0009965B42|nr:ABC transporter permease subunit [Bacillus alkalicellulosilyticus]
MRNFIVLLMKEMNESFKNGKWIWLPIVLMVIAISQPITSYYMPQILEAAGNLPEGAVIEIPIPTGEEVLIGILSQFGTIGTLLFVLATMGVISQERQNGSLTLIMVRPVSALQYIGSKTVAQLCILLVSVFLSYVLAWYYTNLLFSSVPWTMMLSSFVISSLWVMLTVVLTILIGTLVKGMGGIAGASVLILGALSLLTTLLPKYMKWSPGNLRAEATKLLLEGQWMSSVWLVGFSTIGLILMFFILAVVSFQRFERYDG